MVLLLGVGLAACGSDDGGASAAGLDAVEVGGDVGSSPEVDLPEGLEADEVETETLAEGDGAELGDGDSVMVNYWLGNGFTGEPIADSYDAKTPGSLVTLGAEPVQPQTVDQVATAAAAGLVEPGATVGSRLVTVGPPADVLGVPGLPELGIGNLDPVVMVVDLVGQPLSEPEGTATPSGQVPSWVPAVVEEDGVPTALDFQGTPQPTDDLRTATLVEGEGPEVEKGDLLVADYLGQVYDGEEPFDDSYSRGEPAGFGIGIGQVVKGWDRALVGTTVGSRVVLAIPPALGYGKQGSPQAGIEGDDTLYFVIDVLGAA